MHATHHHASAHFTAAIVESKFQCHGGVPSLMGTSEQKAEDGFKKWASSVNDHNAPLAVGR